MLWHFSRELEASGDHFVAKGFFICPHLIDEKLSRDPGNSVEIDQYQSVRPVEWHRPSMPLRERHQLRDSRFQISQATRRFPSQGN
jgi:hypothetical protein